jgi:hypothetical protein
MLHCNTGVVAKLGELERESPPPERVAVPGFRFFSKVLALAKVVRYLDGAYRLFLVPKGPLDCG